MGERALALTVACCLWGGWPRGAEYVEKLKSAVERHLTLPHRFVCFSDRPGLIPPWIETLPLVVPSWFGKLPKLIFYKPGNGLDGRVLGMDLDTVITGSLDDMASYAGEFCVRAAFKAPKVAGGDMVSFEAGYGAHALWEPLVENPRMIELETGGQERIYYRQRIEKPDFWQDLYPDQYVSYKHHCRSGLPAAARLVSFHGHPRPHEVDDAWVRDHWR